MLCMVPVDSVFLLCCCFSFVLLLLLLIFWTVFFGYPNIKRTQTRIYRWKSAWIVFIKDSMMKRQKKHKSTCRLTMCIGLKLVAVYFSYVYDILFRWGYWTLYVQKFSLIVSDGVIIVAALLKPRKKIYIKRMEDVYRKKEREMQSNRTIYRNEFTCEANKIKRQLNRFPHFIFFWWFFNLLDISLKIIILSNWVSKIIQDKRTFIRTEKKDWARSKWKQKIMILKTEEKKKHLDLKAIEQNNPSQWPFLSPCACGKIRLDSIITWWYLINDEKS